MNIKNGVKKVAPDVGFEPTTNRLTADYSTAELIRNIYKVKYDYSEIKKLCQGFFHKNAFFM